MENLKQPVFLQEAVPASGYADNILVIIILEIWEQSGTMKQEQSGDPATKIDLISQNGPLRLLVFVQQFWGLKFSSADIKFYA